MCCGETLPKDIAGHDSSSHDTQQDAAFHGHPAGLIAHLQLHTSQHHHHGHSCSELDQWGAHLGMQCLGRVVGLDHLHLSPGNWVRMSKTCRQFAKGCKGHWFKEIFRMEAVWDTSPVTYVVATAAGEPIRGAFYSPELQKVMAPDCFDFEAILDTRWSENTMQYLLKWAGCPDSFNSRESNVIRISADSVAPCQSCRHCWVRGALSS